MFEFERYAHSTADFRLLRAYLSRVGLRIEALKVYYDIK